MSKKLIAMFLVIVMVGAMFAGCTPKTEEPAETPDGQNGATETEIKVALLLPGSANDQSWSQFGYEALVKVKEELGVETAYSENVTNIDLQQALRDYATKGYNVILGHTGGFEDDMIKVGADFPDTQFVVIAGSKGAEGNVTAVDTAPWQYGYSYGWMAGKVTKTKKVGYITANEGTGTMNNLVGSWKDGVKKSNADVKATVVYLKDADDVAAAREAALAMAADGCDVIMHELNRASQGVIDVAKEKGLLTIGRTPADVEYAPDSVITYCVFDWGPKYVNIVKQAQNKELNGGAKFFGFHTPEAPGFVFTYKDGQGWNPNVVTDEMLELFQKEVVDMFVADPIRTYTVEQAAGGSF